MIFARLLLVVGLVYAVDHGVLQQAPVVRSVDVAPIDGDVLPSARLASSLYPPWAHAHQVWLSSGHTQSQVQSLVTDYLAWSIPVGGVDIDSDWSSGVNNFLFDTSKFPNATQLIANLHALGVRTILWVTSVVDNDSSN